MKSKTDQAAGTKSTISADDTTVSDAADDDRAEAERRRDFRAAMLETIPVFRSFADEVARAANWDDVAERTSDPLKQAAATALARLQHADGPHDIHRFNAYAVARKAAALLNAAKAMFETPEAEPFSLDAAKDLAGVVSAMAEQQAEAAQKVGVSAGHAASMRQLVDATAVQRVLRGRGRHEVKEALIEFLPMAVMLINAAVARTEHPVLTRLRQEDPEIDTALKCADAVGALMALYHPVPGSRRS